MPVRSICRRRFLGSAAATVAAPLVLRTEERAADAGDGSFISEIARREAERKARLSETEYQILRLGGTEPPKSNPMWDSTEAGL